MKHVAAWTTLLAFFGLGSLAADELVAEGEPISFSRDVQPILADHCFACHGPDEKKRRADLRLDTEEGAKEDRDGDSAVVPGKPEESELFRRITAPNTRERMPPEKFQKPLSASEIEMLRRWIAAGAKWEGHWAFVPPRRPAVPEPASKDTRAAWPRGAIDRFILDRLAREGLQPSPEARPETLVRRVTQDLTGLPPTPAEVDSYLADGSPEAYEKLVDRLLASPRHGERMALDWLDAARYADTHGFHIDSRRDMWRWRDGVIDAFNHDQPFDEFTVEQVAGDLLPGATVEQRTASGFNRNHCINFEGGAIPEEYLTQYIIDRVSTTSTVWMGLTLGCAQCHDHKFDPLSQEEFYRFYAFFNRVSEKGLDGRDGNAAPLVKAPTLADEKRLAALQSGIAAFEGKLRAREADAVPAALAWARQRREAPGTLPDAADGLLARFPLDETSGETITGERGGAGQTADGDTAGGADAGTSGFVGRVVGGAAFAAGKSGGALELTGANFVDLGDVFPFERTDAFSYGAWVYPTSKEHGAILARMDDENGFRGYDLYLGGGRVFAHLIHSWPGNAIRVNTKEALTLKTWQHVMMTYDGGGRAAGLRLYVNGQPAAVDATHDSLTDTIRTERPLRFGRRNPGAPLRGRIDEVRFYARELEAREVARMAESDPIAAILALAPEERSEDERAALVRHYLESEDEAYRQIRADLEDARQDEAALRKSIPTAMVMDEMETPRDTFLLVRGEYNRKGKKVTAGTPSVLPRFPDGARVDRLGLARWLVAPAHPLTARVTVNRFWQAFFGTGLVKTAEDFGTQGERPSHPELLDWLAVEFVESGWNVKRLLKLIVTSSTYRQSSRVTPDVLEKDPANRLLARGPRFRLPAEAIRDQALAISGLLVGKLGGPSVKPYQPAGLWREVAYGAGNTSFTETKYVQDTGEKLYRRSMYTFWKRSCPPPALQTFDAPDREYCTVRRSRTNTPLQALVLMNDPTYVEAARKFAERIIREGGRTVDSRLTFAVRATLARHPTAAELGVLRPLFSEQLREFETHRDAALALLEVGESKWDDELDAAEIAAWSAIASLVLNLDEAITKG